jgi:hypothetical protein
VELAVFCTHNAKRNRAYDRHVLQSRAWHTGRASIGSVTGVALDDRRRVVIKAHQPQRSRELLAEIARIQNHLSERGLFAPKVIAGPVPLGNGHAMVEPFNAGATANARRPDGLPPIGPATIKDKRQREWKRSDLSATTRRRFRGATIGPMPVWSMLAHILHGAATPSEGMNARPPEPFSIYFGRKARRCSRRESQQAPLGGQERRDAARAEYRHLVVLRLRTPCQPVNVIDQLI